jgi:hypothetical protein
MHKSSLTPMSTEVWTAENKNYAEVQMLSHILTDPIFRCLFACVVL